MRVGQLIQNRINDIERIEVIGHTSAPASDAYNQALSERRANSIVEFMANEVGIERSKFSATGMGESQLLDPSGTKAAQVVNRRAEFIVTVGGQFKDCM